MRFSLRLLGALVLVGAASLPAQSRRNKDRDRDRDSDDVVLDTTVAIARGAVVDLTLASGEIIVTGWSRAEARIHATSSRGSFDFEATPTRVTLELDGRYGHSGETRFEVSVPFGTRVLTNSQSGDQRIRGVRGEVEARAVSGDLDIDDVGALTFECVSGDVTVGHVAGSLTGSSVSGDLEISDVAGDVRIESTSGEIQLSGIQAKLVRAETVSGSVQFSGTIDRSGRYEFHSHSGDVSLTLPPNVGAQFEIETFSGDVESDFPMTITPSADERRRQHRLAFTLGGGGARITAESFSGSIHLERGTRAGDRE